MNAFWSALMPSLSSSAAGGAAGALKGQIEAPQLAADLDLKKAQAEWQRAHAQMYGQQQKMKMQAISDLETMAREHPEMLHSDIGRLKAYIAGHFDPNLQDARVENQQASAYQHYMGGNLSGTRSDDIEATQPARIGSIGALEDTRKASAGLYNARSADVTAQTPGKVGLLGAKKSSEEALANARNMQAKLYAERAAMLKDLKASGGKTPNLWSLYQTIFDRVNAKLSAGIDPDEDQTLHNEIVMLGDLRDKARQRQFLAVPPGGTMGNVETGKMAIPGQPSPETPMTPMRTTPQVSRTAEYEQAVLAAKQVIKEKGVKYAEDQVLTNKNLSPTARRALQEALGMK